MIKSKVKNYLQYNITLISRFLDKEVDFEELLDHDDELHNNNVPGPIVHDLQADDIKIVFHPNSQIPIQFFRFDDYCGVESIANLDDQSLSDSNGRDNSKPWRPFRTKLDFEIAEVMLDAHMNMKQTEKMLSLIHEAVDHPEEFTLANSTELSKIWDIVRETKAEMVSNSNFLDEDFY